MLLLRQLGSVDISPQPNERTDKVDEAEIGAIQLVEAGEDAAKLLEFVDATFHEMAFAVEPGVVLSLDLGRLMRGNDRFTAPRLDIRDEWRSCIAAIRDDPGEGQAVEQRLGLRAVVALPSGQDGAQGIA